MQSYVPIRDLRWLHLEHKLELVLARSLRQVEGLASSVRVRAEAFRAVVEELASRQPCADEFGVAYRSMQDTARITLRRHREVNGQVDRGGPLESPTTWWCTGCGGVDAPQPCLGISTWRPTAWVHATLYEQERAGVLAEHDPRPRGDGSVISGAGRTPAPGASRSQWAIQPDSQLEE